MANTMTNHDEILKKEQEIDRRNYEEELERLKKLGADPQYYREKGLNTAQLEEVRKGIEAGVDVNRFADVTVPWSEMEELRLSMENGIYIQSYVDQGFDWMQVSEIRLGLEHGIDIRAYAKQEYFSQQMHELRLGLEENLDISVYSDPEYDWFQMEEIRIGLENNADVSVYAHKEYDHLTMRQIRKAMEAQIDLLPYVEKGYDGDTLEEILKCLIDKIVPDSYLLEGYSAAQLGKIRTSIEKEVNLKPYISTEMLEDQLEEILKGLEVGLDVSCYAKSSYGWRQMREIRVGLENRIDVSVYLNTLFSWQQMREIRLGLEAGFDVSSYAKLMYSISDMQKMRQKMVLEEESEETEQAESETESFEVSFVTISHDGMQAELDLAKPKGRRRYKEEDVLAILKNQGVVLGIDKEVIREILDKELYAQKIVVARGQKAIPGQDGRYEFFFRTELPTRPKILPDGSVDYMNMDYFEQVKQGQKLAVYIPATTGTGGYTVGGKVTAAKKGKEKPILRGKGFLILEDERTYISALNGKISIEGYHMEVSKLHIVEGDVSYTTGNIAFNGDLIVRGCVRSGVTLTAGGNMEIEGNVESANLIAEGDILVKEGVQAGGRGTIRAKGRVRGKFFEQVEIVAEKEITANYILNCDITTKGRVVISGKLGALIGGSTRAVEGVDVYNLGNPVETGTVLESGLTKQFFQQYNQIEKNIMKVQSEVRVFKEGIEKFQSTYTKEQLKEISVYEKIKLAYEMKLQELSTLLAEKKNFEEEMEQISLAKINVKGTAYPGVQIFIDRIPLRLADTVRNVTFKHIEDRVGIFQN